MMTAISGVFRSLPAGMNGSWPSVYAPSIPSEVSVKSQLDLPRSSSSVSLHTNSSDALSPAERVLLPYSNTIDWVEITQPSRNIEQLNVVGSQLTSFPHDLFLKECFRELESLMASSNDLTEIKGDLASLKKLKFLFLNKNKLSDGDFVIICKIKALQRLELASNKVSSCPPGITSLSHLRCLNLSHNPLNTFPSQLLECTSLIELSLGDTNLSSIPEGISRLAFLEILDLSGNPLSELPETIRKVAHLKVLDLSATHLSTLPESLPKSLIHLNVSHTLKHISPAVSQLIKLEKLVCNYMKTVYSDQPPFPQEITHLTSLREISVTYSNLTTLPECVAHIPSLRRLDLTGNLISSLPRIPESVEVIGLQPNS
ncbi:MAG: hypothetical protein KDK65_04575 [Chlamydiia bacterium]|nr:hypothetical protein [Chlamydiia bacterium]